MTVQLKKNIQALIKETHQRNRERMAAIDAAEGEQIGKTWSSRFKMTKPRDTINHLRTPGLGETTGDSKKMVEIAGKYHREIQSEDRDLSALPDEQEISEALRPIKARLSTEDKQRLAEKISEDEVRNAMGKMASEKAPGLDSIPIELWRSMDDQFLATRNGPPEKRRCNIVQILTIIFQDIEEYGMDPAAKLNEGCISPIYKKKDPEDIANYRLMT